MSSIMDDIRYKIASYLQEIVNMCAGYGLPEMNVATVIIRNPSNSNMFVIVSNDTDDFQKSIEDLHYEK